MKRMICFVVSLTTFSVLLFGKGNVTGNLGEMQLLNNNNIEFIENRGQVADQHGNVNHDVLFIAEVPNGSVTIRRNGLSYQFINMQKDNLLSKYDRLSNADNYAPHLDFHEESVDFEIYRVDMILTSSNLNPKFEVFEKTEDYNNYYLSHCPDGITYVRKFRTIMIKDVYPNIDFVIYANNDGLVQYDFVVKPSANPELINFTFQGAKDIIINQDGSLIVETPMGNIEHKAPVAYQPNNLKNYLNSRKN